MYQNTILLFVIVGFIAFYYFNKFNESEKEYIKLHGSVREIYNENQKLKLKVKELQAYKDDVSKTFKILDNELVMINDHIQRRQQPQQHTLSSSLSSSLLNPLNSQHSQTGLNRVSLLTPELLNTVFFDIQPQRQNNTQPTAIINTIVENIPVERTENNIQQTIIERDDNYKEEENQTNANDIQTNANDTVNEIQTKVKENMDVVYSDVGIKSLEEKLDERALEEMLKNVEISTMNDVRLMGEENEYNNLLLDLNKFKTQSHNV